MKYFYIQEKYIRYAWFEVIKKLLEEGENFKVGYGSEAKLTKKAHITVHITEPENRPLFSDLCISTNKAKIDDYALTYLWSGEIPEAYKSSYTYGSRLRFAYGKP